MNDPHQALQAFVDGQLSVAEAETFRLHLGTCEKCQHSLHEMLQLDFAAEASKQAMPLPQRAPRRSFRWVGAAIGIAAAAGLALMVMYRAPGQSDPVVSLLGPTGNRHLEARVTWSLGDAYRPYDTVRGAAESDAVPLATLAALEKQGEQQSLAGAWLLSGDAARARALLQKLQGHPDVSADLAAVALAQGHADDALELAQLALDDDPKHARALWNKALAARELGFPAVAAKTFGEVAALGEKGWAEEAAQRQRALDEQWQQSDRQFRQAFDAAGQMALNHVPMPAELVAAAPSTARLFLAYALPSATNRDEVERLLPVAQQVDRLFGGDGAEKSVRRAAGVSFANRGELARGFRGMYVDAFRGMAATGLGPTVAESEIGADPKTAASFARALAAKGTADDLVIGLPFTRALPAKLDVYTRAADATGDQFFRLAAQNERAKKAVGEDNRAAAEQLFFEVTRTPITAAPLRVMQAHEQLAMVYRFEHRAAESQQQALAALVVARTQNDLITMGRLWSVLGDAARFRNLRGLAAAALYERALRRSDSCEATRYYEESMASLHVFMLSPEKARAALSRATTCGEPLSVVGVFALADVIRMQPLPGDEAMFAAALAALRDNDALDPGERVMVDHVEGRGTIDRDPVRGEALLRAAIDSSRTLPADDSDTRKIVAYGFGLLRVAAAEQKRFDSLFALTSEERGHPIPPGCALVLEVQDDRVAIAGRTSAGQISGAFERVPVTRKHREGLELADISRVVMPVAKQAAQGCDRNQALQVYAGFPMNGRTGWLPDDLAWSFASGLPARVQQPGATLVVSDVDAPAELKLPRLAAWTAGEGALKVDLHLRGADATPARVTQSMRDASFIELDAHGLVNTGSADTAMVVLAASPKGYALTAAAVRTEKLTHHPLVLLGACRASTVAQYMHEAWSLPEAFLEAGASSVVAAPVDLPDAEARIFFGRLVSRLATGENPASALRDERVAWLAEGRGSWVRAVLVFE